MRSFFDSKVCTQSGNLATSDWTAADKKKNRYLTLRSQLQLVQIINEKTPKYSNLNYTSFY